MSLFFLVPPPPVVYLLFGVTAMMVTLSVFYNIPSCDFKLFFLLRSSPLGGCLSPPGVENQGSLRSGAVQSSAGGQYQDPERILLQSKGGQKGPKYTQHLDPEPEVGMSKNKTPSFNWKNKNLSFLFSVRTGRALWGPDPVLVRTPLRLARRKFPRRPLPCWPPTPRTAEQPGEAAAVPSQECIRAVFGERKKGESQSKINILWKFRIFQERETYDSWKKTQPYHHIPPLITMWKILRSNDFEKRTSWMTYFHHV